MTHFVAPESFVQPTPMHVASIVASTLRRLRVLAYVLAALIIAVLVGSVAPLGTWLLLCAAVAVPTLASVLIVAAE